MFMAVISLGALKQSKCVRIELKTLQMAVRPGPICSAVNALVINNKNLTKTEGFTPFVVNSGDIRQLKWT